MLMLLIQAMGNGIIGNAKSDLSEKRSHSDINDAEKSVNVTDELSTSNAMQAC